MKKKEEIVGTLQRFAEERLRADQYQDCTHKFDLYECAQCLGTSFHLTIERHPGDEPGDFMGVLRAKCDRCRAEEVKLGVTSYGEDKPKPLSVASPSCPCGSESFYAGSCERWEDCGFFDEGTVVAMCVQCGAFQALVDTD